MGGKVISIVIQGFKNPIQNLLCFVLITVTYSPRDSCIKQPLQILWVWVIVGWHFNSADALLIFEVTIYTQCEEPHYSHTRHNVIKALYEMTYQILLVSFTKCDKSYANHISGFLSVWHVTKTACLFRGSVRNTNSVFIILWLSLIANRNQPLILSSFFMNIFWLYFQSFLIVGLERSRTGVFISFRKKRKLCFFRINVLADITYYAMQVRAYFKEKSEDFGRKRS